jgi:hypothetical protein
MLLRKNVAVHDALEITTLVKYIMLFNKTFQVPGVVSGIAIFIFRIVLPSDGFNC